MKTENLNFLNESIEKNNERSTAKFVAGVKEHGGGLWNMGAKQLLSNIQDENIDTQHYIAAFNKVLKEIEEVANQEVLDILHRIKKD